MKLFEIIEFPITETEVELLAKQGVKEIYIPLKNEFKDRATFTKYLNSDKNNNFKHGDYILMSTRQKPIHVSTVEQLKITFNK